MSKKSAKEEKSTAQPPQPPRWKGTDLMELVYHFNERALTLLKSGLDADAIRRAARFPFLVVDVHFLEEGWWRSVLLNPQGVPAAQSLWPPEIAGKFMSEVLVFAWHTAKWDRQVARLVLGMVPPVVEMVRELTPQQLDAVAGLHSGALKLRWHEDQEFWTKLLNAARDGHEETLADIHLHAKLRLSGQLIEART